MVLYPESEESTVSELSVVDEESRRRVWGKSAAKGDLSMFGIVGGVGLVMKMYGLLLESVETVGSAREDIVGMGRSVRRAWLNLQEAKVVRRR